MKWYQKTGPIVLLLIFFFPVGLFLMWKHTNWNKAVKSVITGVFVLGVIVSAPWQSKEVSTPASTPAAASSSSSSSQPPVEIVSTPSEPSSSEPTVSQADKDAALAIDAQLYQLVLNSERVTTALQDGIALVGDGSGSVLDLYDLAKTCKDSQRNIYSAAIKLKDKKSKDYVDACVDYIINGQMIADNLVKYIDKQEMKYLSDAKSEIGYVQTYILSVLGKRMEYLSSQGFTDEEVLEMIAPDTKSSSSN